MTQIWSVIFVRYVDDHKLRGEEPMELDGPYLFLKLADAEELVESTVRKQLEQQAQYLTNDDPLWSYFEEDCKLKDGVTWEDCKTLAKELFQGDYVPRRWDWFIKETELEFKKKTKL